jgi:amidohydrolase
MIEHGVLQDPDVDAVMAGHMLPDLEVGTVGVIKGQSHASADRFKMKITGVGGHGGRPNQTRDPIVAAAYWITSAQAAAARSIDPLDSAVITVGTINGGHASNIVPQDVSLSGTFRAIGEGVRERILERLQEITRGIETTFEVECDFEVDAGYPPTICDSEISKFLHDTAADLFGADKVQYDRPSTGAEDFAYFAQAKPGSIIRLGCGRPGQEFYPLHSPYFDLDERILGLGVELFTAAVMRYLGTQGDRTT